MPDFARLPRLLAALGLCLPLLASAQATAPMSDAERARRDAEKVFSFIKFQTVPAKPTAEAPRKPARPAAPAATAAATAAPATERPAVTARAPEPTAPAPAAPPAPTATAAVKPLAAPAAADALPAPQPLTQTTPGEASPLALPQPSAALPVAAPATTAPAGTEPEPEADDADDGALQLQNFVAPVLTPAVQATLGPGARNVKVRFTVQADGRVSQADAAANVPHRLAKPAVEAILQWRFAPLPQPRTVDVEIAFRRD